MEFIDRSKWKSKCRRSRTYRIYRMVRTNYCVASLLLVITALNICILSHPSLYNSSTQRVEAKNKHQVKTDRTPVYYWQFNTNYSDDFTTDDRFETRKVRLEAVCLHNMAEYYSFLNMCDQSRRVHPMYYTKSSDPGLAGYLIKHNAASILKNIIYQLGKPGTPTRKNPYLVEEKDFSGLLDTDSHSLPFHKFWNIQNITRFTFVRDPYARLVSSYLDSLYISNPIQWRLLARTIRPRDPRPCVTDITFREYVDFYLQLIRNGKCPERFILTNYQESNPCQVNYHFIGKFEHLEKDIAYILEHNGLKKNFSIAHFQTDSDVTQITKMVTNIFDNQKDIRDCDMTLQSAIKRMWRRLQSKGILGIYDDPPEGVRDDNQQSTIQTTIMKAYLMGNMYGRQENKVNVLKEAYAYLPSSTIAELQHVFKLEFQLFGYHIYPGYIRTAKEYSKLKGKFTFFEF